MKTMKKETIMKILIILGVAMMIGGPAVSFFTSLSGVKMTPISYQTEDGVILSGMIYEQSLFGPFSPSGQHSTAPLIVTLHGINCNFQFMNQINIELARHGYVVLSFSQRGHGLSTGENTFIGLEVMDMHNFTTYVQDNYASTFNIMANSVAFIGHSLGAYTTACSSALPYRSGTYVNASIPIACGSNISALINERVPIPQILLYMMGWKVNIKDINEAEIRSPLYYINSSMYENWTTNFLAINGEFDEFFTQDEQKEMVAAAAYGNSTRADEIQEGVVYGCNEVLGTIPDRNNSRKYTMIPGVEHLMECFVPETTNEIITWLDYTFYGTVYPIEVGQQFLRLGGGLIGVFGMLIALLPLISYLTIALKTRKEDEFSSEALELLNTKSFVKCYGSYFIPTILVGGAVPLIILGLQG
ncbi:MAG: alpha/beta hydrolase family protein, partial [Candidatus Helarchaeota archaeon]